MNFSLQLNALVDTVRTNGAEYLADNTETAVQANIKTNFDWLDVHRDPVINWLVAYRTNGSSSLSASTFAILAMFVTLLLCRFN